MSKDEVELFSKHAEKQAFVHLFNMLSEVIVPIIKKSSYNSYEKTA